MNRLKNYLIATTGLVILVLGLSTPSGQSQRELQFEIQTLMSEMAAKSQAANDEAARAAEKQRDLVKSLAGNGNSRIGGAIAGKAADGNEERQQPGRLTSREIAREKAVLQQFEANARRAAEVRESAKKLTAELERKQGGLDGIQYLVAVTQLKAQTASDEALHGAKNQRKLVKQQELLRSPARESTKRIAGPVTSESGALAARDNDERQQPGRLTARELAREKAVLQQLEANAKRSAEVLESVKRLAAEVNRQPRR